jgi:hypothetical protein
MAIQTEVLRSEGGFGVNEKVIITDEYDIKNANTLEVKNSEFANCSRRDYVLRLQTNASTPSGILSLFVASATPITLDISSINFITGHIIGTNANGSGFYAVKSETTVTVDAIGGVTAVSELLTTLKDSIPSGEGWTVSYYDTGNANQFSYNVGQGSASGTILWTAHVQVVSADW